MSRVRLAASPVAAVPSVVAVLPIILVALLAAGCTGTSPTRSAGGYYGGDGPPADWPVNPDSIPMPCRATSP